MRSTSHRRANITWRRSMSRVLSAIQPRGLKRFITLMRSTAPSVVIEEIIMNSSLQLDFERVGAGRSDETDISLRAYVARLPEEHLAKYDRNWSDEQVMAWDGNFKNDGDLMLVCC